MISISLLNKHQQRNVDEKPFQSHYFHLYQIERINDEGCNMTLLPRNLRYITSYNEVIRDQDQRTVIRENGIHYL